MSIIFAITLAILSFFTWSLLHLIGNYNRASKTGLPIFLHPFDTFSIIWLLSKDLLTPILRRLPFDLGAFTYRAEVGWNSVDKYSTHERVDSDAFLIVTPGENELFIADPTAAEEVMRRRNDFIKNPAMYQILDIFGPSTNTVNGKAWERHRRITVPPFNERNSGLVWSEARMQSGQALQAWQKSGGVTSTQGDCMTLALHVLTAAGFGTSYAFEEGSHSTAKPESGHSMTYRDTLKLLLDNMVVVIFLRMAQKARFPDWIMFGKLKTLAKAHAEFKVYMAEMIGKERRAYENDEIDKFNLLSVLVRSNEQAKKVGEKDASPTAGSLNENEVYGNLFIYSLAGHDTTANTIHFALTMLAINPNLQDWIAEEIDAVIGSSEDGLDYEDLFPKLPRCLALMFETLRLYGPVPSLPRYTTLPQHLTISQKSHLIPPNTNVYVNFAALHTHPRYWSPDPLYFRPDRWLVDRDQSAGGEDSLLQPTPGSFVPWNHGPRICPGKKFSQVEFVSVIATLFRRGMRVNIAARKGESREDAKRRAVRVVEGARVDFTLKMVRGEEGAGGIELRWAAKGNAGLVD